MSDRKQTPDVLADILGAENVVETSAPRQARPSRSAAPRRPAPSQRPLQAVASSESQSWEYLVVSFQDHRGWRPRYEAGVEVAGWIEGPSLQSYLEARGREGWELAAACSGKPMFGALDCYQLYFKKRRD